ncbi:alpha-L-fucosidase [Mucilaginibacter calamicampi]|uniref:alpha-L-fucosidase n=1 Tax=Mucilaginibacter calamicampi TaxID=1302352 RepID=A0ABW2YY92_9SPHI
MLRKTFYTTLISACLTTGAMAQTKAPQPVGPVPTENQLRWQNLEYYTFIHYSVNTYTDQEWGNGAEDPKIFNPTNLDCDQWARVVKEAGMKGIIITAKHHSGFCLWPSKYTEYSVKNSPWKNGKGDIVGDLAKACKKYDLKLGIYLSPWDRNRADYGKPEYITYFRNQLRELLTNYGEIYEVWFDGANGGSGYYGGANETRRIDRKTYYDWQNTYKLVRELQPKAVIWNDNGDRADLRWVGTESGYVGETNWSLLNSKGDVPENELRFGVENGDWWVPGEVNTSVRPGWFYHFYEDSRVKSLPVLMNTYYNSVGRNAPLLLNFPIDRRGLIHETDAKNTAAFAKAVKEAFAVNLVTAAKASASNVRGNVKLYSAANAIDASKESYWATNDGVNNASLTITFSKPTSFNNFMAQEYIRLGQRVKKFKVEALVEGQWKEIINQTTIGYKRILRFPTVKATQVRFTILDAKASPLISNIGIYNAPQILAAPHIVRNAAGAINITAEDNESVIYYTRDGSNPTRLSSKYSGPIETTGKTMIKAIAYDANSMKYGPVAEEKFDIIHKEWKIVGISDAKANDVIDGSSTTAWYQPRDKKLPSEIVIDLGKTENLTGFKYLPGQGRSTGLISKYKFYVSNDNVQWKVANEGEFSNIQNNPLWQVKSFPLTKGRYIKLQALGNTQNNDAVGYAEIDVVTE